MTAQSGVILWFKDISKEDEHAAGEKATQLGELLQASFPIPDGFVVTTLAYFHFLHENKLIPKITQLLETINYEHPESVMQVAAHIEKLIMSTKWSETFTADVSHAYHKLCGVYTNAPVNLILPHETIENIHGEANLLQKIKQTYALHFTPVALMNRHNKHMNQFQEGIAIVIQRRVNADISGVLLTSDPATYDRTKNIIEAIDETTDHYVVTKHAEQQIVEKNVAGSSQKVSDQQILALSALGTKLEKYLYFPQEIHWAIERTAIYIVHTKPLIIQKPAEDKSTIAHKLPLLLKGVPASRGIATGVVRKITGANDLEHIAHGDIVVASDITPIHTEMLKKAAGLVTDRGGRTSPIALFAREWGIPAVVGSVYATKNVQNGHLITIDGAKGEIYKGSLTSFGMTKNKTRIFVLLSGDHQNNTDTLPFTDGTLLVRDNIAIVAASGQSTHKQWREITTPAALMTLDELITNGIDGIVVDIDKITTLLLGIDKDNNETAYLFDATHHAVLRLLENTIKIARNHSIQTIIYGNALYHHTSLIEKLVTWGVTGIAIESNYIDQTRKDIIEIERRLIENQNT